MKNSRLMLPMVALFAWLAVGCGNPASDAPQAQVSEPAPPVAAEPATADDSEMQDDYADATIYDIGDESTVGFVGSKVTGSHEGGFNDFEGRLMVVDNDPSRSKVEVSIDATSLYADSEKLTGHLKSADFFDVETYPRASFESTSIVAADKGYTVTGNLSLHGVTKQIVFPAMISVDEAKATASAEFSIKRFDFAIEYKGMADDLIRDDVLIKLHLVASPTPAPVS